MARLLLQESPAAQREPNVPTPPLPVFSHPFYVAVRVVYASEFGTPGSPSRTPPRCMATFAAIVTRFAPGVTNSAGHAGCALRSAFGTCSSADSEASFSGTTV